MAARERRSAAGMEVAVVVAVLYSAAPTFELQSRCEHVTVPSATADRKQLQKRGAGWKRCNHLEENVCVCVSLKVLIPLGCVMSVVYMRNSDLIIVY